MRWPFGPPHCRCRLTPDLRPQSRDYYNCMAVTHNFNDSPDLAGGWSDDNGRPLCTWTWDQASGHIVVTCGTQARRLKLPHSEADLRGEQLRKHLARTALHLAEDINATKYQT